MSENYFTIQVKKTEYAEDIDYLKLELFHEECLGGKIEWKKIQKSDYTVWEFECKRCGNEDKTLDAAFPAALIKAAVSSEKMFFIHYKIKIIQKP